MSTHTRIVEALDTLERGANLFSLASVLKFEGMEKQEMYEIFDQIRLEYEKSGEEEKYNAVLDTMDFITGYCSKEKTLF